MLYIAVCDDEEYYRKYTEKLIRHYLNQYQIESRIDLYSSGKELLSESLHVAEYQIMFLDINMEELDGLETAQAIRKYNTDGFIVFVTAFIHYALEGYKVNAVRYILKEDISKSIGECIQAILKKMEYQNKKLTLSFIEGENSIFLEKILYIESQKHKLYYYILRNTIITYSIYDKLDHMEKMLSKHGFLRIHKSYLVNAKYIQKISNYKAYVSFGIELPIPREKFQTVKENYIQYTGFESI